MRGFSGTRAAGAALAVAVVGVVTVVASMALSGLAGPPGLLLPRAAADALPAFDSCAALQSWYSTAAAAQVTAYGLSGGYAGDVGFATAKVMGPTQALDRAAQPSAAGSAELAPGAVGNGATGTNIQEAGVDEPDSVKTDGRHVVGLSGDKLWVADATGDTPKVLGSLRLSSYAAQLLLDGDRVILLGGGMGGVRPLGGVALGGAAIVGGPGMPSPYAEATRITVVDIADPTAPRVVSTEDVDGSVLAARLASGVARIVVSTGPRLGFTQPGMPVQPGATSGPTVTESEALRSNQALVRTAKAQDWLPTATVRDASGAVVSQGPLLSCADVRHPVKPAGVRTLTVLTVDPHGAKPFAAAHPSAVAADGNLVYASPSRLYVATSQWGFWNPARSADQVTTQIHAFDISGGAPASYLGSGVVPGFLLSQWSMSEQDGYLRVAVTTGTPTPPMGEGVSPAPGDRSQSSVIVLAQRGPVLAEVGRVDGLGRGERVWSVRWLGDLAAVVTFRQTDPLYLVDLSDPTAPRLRGALELTGYSAYLHPVGDGLLLGVGHEADAAGHLGDAQVSLFDVRDPSHPTRLDRVLLGRGSAMVENDTHAFTYLPGRGLAILPFTAWDMPVMTPGGFQNGMPVQPASAAVGITVRDGRLADAGRIVPGGYQQVQRILPVGERLVAWTGSSLITVDPSGLRTLGTATVG